MAPHDSLRRSSEKGEASLADQYTATRSGLATSIVNPELWQNLACRHLQLLAQCHETMQTARRCSAAAMVSRWPRLRVAGSLGCHATRCFALPSAVAVASWPEGEAGSAAQAQAPRPRHLLPAGSAWL
jgi:hypothetical protein